MTRVDTEQTKVYEKGANEDIEHIDNNSVDMASPPTTSDAPSPEIRLALQAGSNPGLWVNGHKCANNSNRITFQVDPIPELWVDGVKCVLPELPVNEDTTTNRAPKKTTYRHIYTRPGEDRVSFANPFPMIDRKSVARKINDHHSVHIPSENHSKGVKQNGDTTTDTPPKGASACDFWAFTGTVPL
jgi:hypothetical protein